MISYEGSVISYEGSVISYESASGRILWSNPLALIPFVGQLLRREEPQSCVASCCAVDAYQAQLPPSGPSLRFRIIAHQASTVCFLACPLEYYSD